MAVASDGGPRPWRGDEALRIARPCYDHLAGKLGVALADALVAGRQISLAEDRGQVTAWGASFLDDFGIDLAEVRQWRRAFCRPCLDWSERRPHLAGSVGAALATRCFELGWIERSRDCRAVVVTPEGSDGFVGAFGISPL